MAKPPPDADPEKFVIGKGSYSSLKTAVACFDDRVFRLDARPMPIGYLVFCNLVFVAFFFGCHWVVSHFSDVRDSFWAVYVAPIGVGLLTCGGFTFAVYYSIRQAQRLGPSMIYDKVTRQVALPREGECFDRQEVVTLQYVTTKRLDWSGRLKNERVSEVNLITCRNGVRRRWGLLRSISDVKAFDYLLRPLVEQTDLPVSRIEDEWFGWKITERSFE